MTPKECKECLSVCAYPADTYIDNATCFSSPSGLRQEHVTVYTCANCYKSFEERNPACEVLVSQPQYHFNDTGVHTSADVYTGRVWSTKYIASEKILPPRQRVTANISDIKSVCVHVSETGAYILTERNMDV